MSLIAELKRRKVFKVGAAYLVVAWLAVQAASVGFPAFDAPLWALRVFILMALLGFPIVLVLTWVIDLTPDGVKLDANTTGSKRIFVAAALLIALALGWYYYGQPSFRRGDAATPIAADPYSLAVLPFANMSGKADEDYFSDGMTEELLNVLAKVPQLKVVARTSVFQFKGKGGDVREIGRKLGVTHIVEGSVRRDGQEIRVTAQLVRVSDGFHVWSETYDRKLEGVFALQDDIARHVGDALKLSLGVTPAVTARVPIDPVAYDEYLKGRTLYRQRRQLPEAITHLQAAVARAPQFAAGWASLSLALEVAYWKTSPQERAAIGDLYAQQVSAAEHAVELDSNAAMTLHALANVARAQGRFSDAERGYVHAMQVDPSYPDVREDYAELLVAVGRYDDSEAAARKLVTLEPYVNIFWWRLAHLALLTDRAVLLREAAGHMHAIDPQDATGLAPEYFLQLNEGHLEAARAPLAVAERAAPALMAPEAVMFHWAAHDPGADEGQARELIRANVANSIYAALRPDPALFFDSYDMEQAKQARYSQFDDLSFIATRPLISSTRAKDALVRFGFVAYWREKGWPSLCHPVGSNDFACDPPSQTK